MTKKKQITNHLRFCFSYSERRLETFKELDRLLSHEEKDYLFKAKHFQVLSQKFLDKIKVPK